MKCETLGDYSHNGSSNKALAQTGLHVTPSIIADPPTIMVMAFLTIEWDEYGLIQE